MDKHPDCADRCQINEHKGYPPCDGQGFCQLLEDERAAKESAYVSYHLKRDNWYSDGGISAWIHGAGDRPSDYFRKEPK